MAAPKKTKTLLDNLDAIAEALEARGEELSLGERSRINGAIIKLTPVAKSRPGLGRGKRWK